MFSLYLLRKISLPIPWVLVKFGVVTGIFLLSTVAAYGVNIPDTVIQPSGEETFIPARPIQIAARINDSAGIIATRCYFRFQGMAGFVFIDLESGHDGIYRGILPAPADHVDSVEYLFLAVNGNRQVVRTSIYTKLKNENSSGFEQNLPPALYSLKTDLIDIPLVVEEQFLDSGLINMESVNQDQRFGFIGGVYDPEIFSELEVTEGYFGGFLLGADQKLSQVKGILLNQPLAQTNSSAVTSQLQTNEPLTDQVVSESDIIGPDIRGDDWSGFAYVMDSQGRIYLPVPVKAVITQNVDNVTVSITYLGTNWWGIGNYFWGTIFSDGNMVLYDQNLPPQTWTTHFGPATTTSVSFADWKELYDPETNPRPDLYVVDLTRDPPPEPPSFLPGILGLLLR